MDISSSAKMANHALLPMSFENNNVFFGAKKTYIFQACLTNCKIVALKISTPHHQIL